MGEPLPPPNGRVVWPTLVALRECMVQQLIEIGRPVCNLPIYWGDAHMPAQRCTCECADGGQGEGWIRVVRVDAAAQPGTSTNSRYLATNCVVPEMVVTVEVGVWRCGVVLNDDGSVKADAVYDEHAMGMVDDMAALQRLWGCCGWFEARPNVKRQFDTSMPLGPSGACTGVVVTGRFSTADCSPCPTPDDNGGGEG